MKLQRITTEYSQAEDRIRLAGEGQNNQVVSLWLTQRLLNRLVPHLCQWLVQQEGTLPLTEVRQEFAQQKALAELESQPPVRADADTQGVLVCSVDVKSIRLGVMLQFKDRDGKLAASLQLQSKPLRQWLNILHGQYQRGAWPTGVWPAWIAEAKRIQKIKHDVVLH